MTYWDDVFIGDVADVVAEVPNLLPADGQGFEGSAPSYWSASGAGATWSTAQAHSGTHALALSGAGAASWTQGEVIRNWVDKFPANAALTLGAWVYTEGVNTAPGSDAEKYQIVYTFRDAAGADILGQPVVLDLPQSAASTGGWVEVTTASLGDIILPVDAVSVTAEVRKGAGATGTVYVDDFFVRGGGRLARLERGPAGRLVHVLAGLRRRRGGPELGGGEDDGGVAHRLGVAPRGASRRGASRRGGRRHLGPRAGDAGRADARLVLAEDGGERRTRRRSGRATTTSA